MGRAPCCDKENVKRGTWSPEEDATLKNYLETHGTGGSWIALPKKAGLRRCGKSCRLRWLNYLRPNIKHGGFTEEEDNIICSLYSQMGSRWSTIASKLPGRTDNDIKNYWNTKLKKKIMAGEVKIKSLTDNDTFPSTSQIAKTQNSTQNSDIFASTNQNPPPSATLPMLELDNYYDANHGFEQIHQSYNPSFMENIVSEIGASNNNVNVPVPMVSLSQEGSSISDSSSIAMNNNKCVSQQQEQAGDDFGFGFDYDLVNGPNCHERIDDFAPSCSYPEWVDFSYADFKPH